jgi:hypothetical protein
MEIKFFAGTNLYSLGDFCSSLVEGAPNNTILCEGSEKEEGVVVNIRADNYTINKKFYPLGQEYSVKAVLTEDGRLVPMLRKSHGLEIGATQTLIQGTVHVPAEKIGPKTNVWPIISSVDLNYSTQNEIKVIEDAYKFASIISKNKEEEEVQEILTKTTQEEVEIEEI